MPLKKDQIEQYFSGLSDLSCLVIGDSMIDEYIYGEVERMSPEAPVPVVKLNRKERRLGGAANVGLNLASLGVKTMLCSIVGKDVAGNKIRDLLEFHQIETRGLYPIDLRPTTIKTRVISNGNHLLRIDDETDELLSTADRRDFENHVKNCIRQFNPKVVIFEDYDKGCLYPEIIKEIIGLCHQLSIKITADPKFKNFLSYSGCDLFKPNFKELIEAADLTTLSKSRESIESCLEILSPKLQAGSYLITLSEKGVYYRNEHEQAIMPAYERNICDVSGAGDTVIAVASTALAMGLQLNQIAILSNLAGGLVCEEVGVIAINKEKFKKEALALETGAVNN